LSQWLQVYAGALIDWELGICERLVNESFPLPPQAVDISTLFRNGTKALVDKKYRRALDMLTYLIQATSEKLSQPILNELIRATLLVFIGRIYLYDILDEEVARGYFEQARDLAPQYGQPYAALGEYYQLKKDHNKAQALYQQAIDRSPNQPDGYIGMGLLQEDKSLWDEADDYYEEAIETVQKEKDIQVALSKLLAPISGNLYLQLARQLKKQAPEQALQAVDLAITTGIKHEGAHPERLGYRLKGEILESLKREQEAAEAYYEAGWRFTRRNEGKIAVELLQLALKLAQEQDAKYLLIYWELADALRVSSYRTKPPYVEEEPILESLATWEAGIAKASSVPGGLDSNLSFICTERAMINEQLARLPGFNPRNLYWEGVAYLERAVLSDGENPYSWANLARHYRFLEQESNSLHASRAAFDLNSKNPFVLEEQLSIFANVGYFDAALDMIKKRQELGADIWVDSVKAYVLIRKSMYQEALELLQPAFESAPDEIWYYNLRASCYHLLDDPENARKDYEWIWNRYSETDVGNQDTFGWAAYNLALLASDADSFNHFLNESIRIFESRILQKEKLVGVGEIHRYLGLSYLARNDVKAGEKNLDVSIEEAVNTRELEDLLKLDFPLFEKSLHNWPHKDQIVEVLNRLKEKIKEKIKERKTQPEQRCLPEEELQEVVEKHPRAESEINWAWTAAQAGLARLYSEAKRWSDSAGIYLLLQKEGERFPEAYLGPVILWSGSLGNGQGNG